MESERVIVAKDTINNCWWEQQEDGSYKPRPFGHYVFLFINSFNAQRDKETFINNEMFYLSGSKNNPTALEMKITDEAGNVTRSGLAEYYEEKVKGNELIDIWKKEFDLFVLYLKNLKQFRNGKNATKDLFAIYNYFKYISTSMCSPKYFDYLLLPSTAEDRNDFFDPIYSTLIKAKGFVLIGDEESPSVCQAFECSEIFDVFILDLWEFIFNPACEKATVRWCKHCGSVFIDGNNKTQYCEACRQPEIMSKIRYANRKSNKARKLHHEVLTLAYGLNKKSNDDSNAFLNESNYYWDIVQGKKPEKVKGYSNRIKTESDYISWLEKKRDEYRKRS